jgi:hypothetical protein
MEFANRPTRHTTLPPATMSRSSQRRPVVVLQQWALRVAACAWVFLGATGSTAMAQPSERTLEGTNAAGQVLLIAGDGAAHPAAGARVVLTCGIDEPPRVEIVDDAGSFRFDDVPPVQCEVSIDLQGFKPVTTVIDPAQMAALRFVLQTKRLAVPLTVRARAGERVLPIPPSQRTEPPTSSERNRIVPECRERNPK